MNRQLERLLTKYDATLIPAAEAGADAPASFTTISVPDMDRATELAAALREMNGVESAYAKPGEELP